MRRTVRLLAAIALLIGASAALASDDPFSFEWLGRRSLPRIAIPAPSPDNLRPANGVNAAVSGPAHPGVFGDDPGDHARRAISRCPTTVSARRATAPISSSASTSHAEFQDQR